MHIEITDDFDLEKIARSGQCFRARPFPDGAWRFVTGPHAVYIRPLGGGRYWASCPPARWTQVWRPYFDLDRDYAALRARAAGLHPFVDRAMAAGRGLRVLRQDPWETLLTFIASQRKSIPAIAKTVEALAAAFGDPLSTGRETLCTFPSPAQLAGASPEQLRACALGYRTEYVRDAVRLANAGQLDPAALARLDDGALLRALQSVRGVGRKVASCVGLFGYGRTAMAPVDVWISRAIREECGGADPFPLYGPWAGIIQQYIFYYQKNARPPRG